MKKSIYSIASLVGLLALSSCGVNTATEDANTLNIYASRHYDVDKKIIESFENETGIDVNLLELKPDELIVKLMSEGENTPADLVFMNGAENITALQETGLTKNLTAEIPASVDSKYYGDNWVGITRRARVFATTKDNDNVAITSYDDIMSDDFDQSILVRSSDNSYNQALIASMIQDKGEDYATDFVTSMVEHMARTPEGNDRDQAKAMVAGDGDIAMINTYYMHLLNISSDDAEVAVSNELAPYELTGIYENISFVTPLTESEEVDQFIEYLLTEDVQSQYAEVNGEYPVNSNSKLTGYISTLPKYEYAEVDFETLGNYIEKAYEIMIENGWK